MYSLCVAVILTTFLTIAAAPANAALWGTDARGELTGSRTSTVDAQNRPAGGVDATGGWRGTNSNTGVGNFVLDWNISYDAGLWTYRYTANANRKGISHFLLEVTNDGSVVRTGSGTDTNITSPQSWDASSDGKSNPSMPNPLYGVKFDFGGLRTTYTFVTDRAPVYGVFYAKDGKDGGTPVVAWSTALNYSDYKTNSVLSTSDFIVRPDGVAAPVPIPGVAWLLGSGLLGLAGIRRRHK